MGLKHLKLKYRYLFKVIFREYFMAKETQENAFGKELLELLMEKKMWRQPIINRIGKKGADRLFSYYSTCRGIEKQVKNPGLNCNIERIEDIGNGNIKITLSDKQVHYSRRVTLPREVRPYFENLRGQ